jgi:glutamate carboxypeptidase
VTSAPAEASPASLDLQAVRSFVGTSFPDYVRDLESLVNIDCGTFLPEGVNAVADRMQERFRADGWSVERRPHSPGPGDAQLGDVVIASVDGSGGRRVLLVGHMDTVFPAGTARERPYRSEGDRAFGPGVSDMKGGLLAGFYAVKALRDSGFDDFARITYVCNPDEEIGSPFSGPFIRERAGESDVCFVLEGARENGDIVSARKGVIDLRVTVTGRAAHAGVEPERGRSAIVEAARIATELHGLNGRWPGVTVNVGWIEGGIRPNVVAERCEMRVDLRIPTEASRRDLFEEISRIAERQVVADTTVELQHETSFPPMEKTDAIGRLVEKARALASGLGFEVKDAATGGGSDANPVAGMGVPVLDGLGPIGGNDHAPGEWLDLSSVEPRTTLLAGMVATSP